MQGLAAVQAVHGNTEDEGHGGVQELGRDEDTEGRENSFPYFWVVCWPDIGCQGLQYCQYQTAQFILEATTSPHFHHLQPGDFPLLWKSNLVPGEPRHPGMETSPAPLKSGLLTRAQ